MNKTTAILIDLHDRNWQLGNALRDCISRLDTIREQHPNLSLDGDLVRARFTLHKYAPGPAKYAPHPFGWPVDLPPPIQEPQKDFY